MSAQDYVVERVRLRVPELKRGAVVRFAQMSDLHLRPGEDRFGRLAQDMARRDLDFVFISGDLPGEGEGAWETVLDRLAGLRARHGVYACRGNWGLNPGLPRLAEQRRTLARSGVTLLVNESRTVELPAGRVRIAGLDDALRGWPVLEETLHEGRQADWTVMLAHEPMALDMLRPEHRVNLVLSGHTHGGQVRVPVLWRLLLPDGTGGYTDGLFRRNGRMLYVNRGHGVVGMKFRFRCPAQVALFELAGG